MYVLPLYMGLAFLYWPLLIVCYDSIGPLGSLFTNYFGLLSSYNILAAFVSSVQIAFVSGVLAIACGVTLALLLRDANKLWPALLFAYAVFPDVILALGMLNILMLIGVKPSVLTLISAYVVNGIAYVTPLIIVYLDSIKPEERLLEDVAQDLGANHMQTIWHIVLPRMSMLLVALFLYIVSLMLDDVVYCGILAGAYVSTLPVIILSKMRQGVDPQLNALSAMIIAALVLVIPIYKWLSKSGAIYNDEER